MSSTDRLNNLLVSEDWQKVYQSFKNADFQSYDFENLRRTMIDYIRTNFPEDFNDYIESSEYMALIDLIAYIGQSIAFRVDLNARENFLELAERRDSILRLARLISYNANRNTAASGLLKFNTIATTENVLDSNGRNLSGQYITWNDASNANWYDQFIKIINAALPSNNQFGTPIDQATIYNIPTSQYRFNAANNGIPLYTFTKPISGKTMDFEITSTTFSGKSFIYEEAPRIGNSIACVHMDDGYGAGSAGTGFFFHFTQGTLNQGTFTITQPSSNQTIDIDSPYINNSDVWLYQLGQSNAAESALWSQVPSLTGNNVIYNSLTSNLDTIYHVITRANDAISLSFGDGTFGKLPLGTFRVYYRVSNGLTYTINPSDIVNVSVSIPYVSVSGQAETLTVSLNLASSVQNAAAAESNASVKANAPATYYTQNRMITGEDYNVSPLSATTAVAKIKAINRTSSGISRYFDLIDPTGKYSATNLYATDGILYREFYSTGTTFTYKTQTDINSVIYNKIFPIISSPDVRNFYYANFVKDISATVKWHEVTFDSNSSTGYLVEGNGTSPAKRVGADASDDFKYFTVGSLVKFEAPYTLTNNVKTYTHYFDTTKNNILTTVPTSGQIKKGGAYYVWAAVVAVDSSVQTSGSSSGILVSGVGAITLTQPFNTTNGVYPTVTQIIPKFSTTIESSVVTTMIDLIAANDPFGLRYDLVTQSWQIIFEENLNTSRVFTLGNAGSTTNKREDSSWMLAFATNNEVYTVTTRKLRYIFESNSEVTFYFNNDVKIYDTVSSTIVTDAIKVLGINTQPDSIQPFTADLNWEVVSPFVGLDGYVDPKKLVIAFKDSDNNGVVDNPQLFLDIVAPTTNSLTKYVVQQRYSISVGQDDYKYVKNDPDVGPVRVFANESLLRNTGLSQYAVNQYFYIADIDTVKVLTSSGTLEPTLDYKVYVGRDDLKFQYTHSADYDSRIDPGASNIIDVYVLTNSYNTQYRQWLAGANVAEPLPPSSDALNSTLSPSLNLIKSISDEIIYHPVSYKLLFGSTADITLQANFNVTINPASAVTASDVTARVLIAIDQFFSLDNWNFGDTFYFSELATYVLSQLAPDVTNFVIVPVQVGKYFGSLFEIQCPSNEIFVSSATADNIIIVSGLTSTNLKTLTGPALTAATTQAITSAKYGASN